ncbi:MAG: VanW family protein [Anaerolineae bacterium]|nr:VanW family protein [Anaerolineae bacterium]
MTTPARTQASGPEARSLAPGAQAAAGPGLGVALFRFFLTLVYLAGIALLVGCAYVAWFQVQYAGRIYPGVSAAGIPLGGLTPQEAEARLEAHYQYPASLWPTLVYGERRWKVSPAELGVRLDAADTAMRAYRLGRDGPLFHDLWLQAQMALEGYALEPTLTYDPALTAAYLRRLAQEVDQPVRDAVLVIRDLQVSATTSQVGRQVDVAATRDLLERELRAMAGRAVPLVVREILPTVANVDRARQQVEQMIAADLRLLVPAEIGKGPWVISREELAAMLRVQQVKGPEGTTWEAWLDQKALTERLEEIAAAIQQEARDARFDFDPITGTLTPIVMSQNAYRLDVAASLERINHQVFTPDRDVMLVVEITRPKVSVEDAPTYGIRELVSKGTTSFRGSSAGRIKNIQVAASKFHGIVVPPGEVFSFNHYLGEVTAEEGYEESLIIFGDQTVPDVGGGICQVSTTAFRAAFWGGFEIVERWPHKYRVSWYEPPVGLDATIYSPLVDFKFRNDTSHHLLIETEVDLTTGTLTFYFYGTRTGRQVEMEGPFIENEQEPEPPLYKPDPTLPLREIRQVEWAVRGMDVTVRRIVREGDRIIHRDTFVSRYAPWRAVYLVGTGEQVEVSP